jgi:NAD(P)H-flavin reductase
MIPVPYRVTGRSTELADTHTLAIEPVADVLPAPRPGQFNMLWAFGVGEVPISISRMSARDQVTLHTVRAVGATSRALCTLTEGDTVGVRGPFGRGWNMDAAHGHDVIVVAGGLGLAPLRPIVDAIIGQRDAFGRVAILMGARSPDAVLFRDELDQWRDHADLDVQITVDHARDGWHENVGVVTNRIPRIPFDPGAAIAFVCGPEVMMRFASTALCDAGVPAERIQLSLERNMACAIAHCGHCQLGPTFVCREGPVYALDAIAPLLAIKAL